MQTHESVNYAEQLSGAIQKDTKKKGCTSLKFPASDNPRNERTTATMV